MTDQELERRLERALSHAAPDDLEGVLSRCETRKGNVLPMNQTTTPAMRWLAAACLALLLVGGGGGVAYQQAYAVASVVSLDVNPSIELKVNKNEKVLSCVGLNEEAQEVLADMGGGADLKGTKLDVAVNAIVGSLVRHGYLDSISSAILISVEDKDQNRAAKLQQELTAAVDAVLQEQSANAAVLSQTLTQDAALAEQARENNISTGKAALANRVLAINSDLKFDELAVLSVEELKDLIEAGVPGMPIGKSAAVQAAERYAGILGMDSVTSEVDPELDEEPSYYEVKLSHPTFGKFEYKIHAYTGAVLSGQPNVLSVPADGAQITAEKAQEVALAHNTAQYPTLKQYDAQNMSSKSEKDDGRLVYEIKFSRGGYKFEYEIDAVTGAVLDWDTDYKNTTTKTESSGGTKTETSGSTSYIGEDAAKAAALSHAGVQASAVKYCNVWLEYDDGRPECYEVEFEANGTEYEYEIDLYNGAVLNWESETKTAFASSSDASKEEKQNKTRTALTEDDAKAVVLNHAGVKESQTAKLKVDLEDENGRPVYEVEFKAGNTEYEYKIDGITGAVLEHECEEDD